MTRYFFGFICVLALGVMGCGETAGTGGAAGDGGQGGTAGRGGSAGMGGGGGSDIYGACPSPAESEAQLRSCESVDECRDDFNECTHQECEGGACTQLPVEDGTGCDQDNECSVSGACTDGGCVATPAEDGAPCGEGAGMCLSGSCSGRFACSEAGIRAAIAVGGGPHTFDCDGPTTVLIESTIDINNDVILDGEDNLFLGGGWLEVTRVVTLRRMVIGHDTVQNIGRLTLEGVTLTEGRCNEKLLTRIINARASLFVRDSSISDSHCGAILNIMGYVEVTRSTIRDNRGLAIYNVWPGWSQVTASTIVGNDRGVLGGPVIIDNSTISDNGIAFSGNSLVTATSSTIVGDTLVGACDLGIVCRSRVCLQGSVASGACEIEATSLGHNVESEGDTCGFDQGTDQVNVTGGQLNLGPLADNGGPTETHALLPGSVAIDVIPADMCEVTEDQRGEPRDSMCDVGAFEVQPAP